MLKELKVDEVEKILYQAMNHLGVWPHSDVVDTATNTVVANIGRYMSKYLAFVAKCWYEVRTTPPPPGLTTDPQAITFLTEMQ